MRLPATTTEYVHVTISAPAGVDLSDTVPRLAFLPQATHTKDANPESGDWLDGAWSDGEALLLVGPDDGTVLPAGDYWVWINVDPPGAENVVRPSGVLTIY